jgi:hypothetical protein
MREAVFASSNVSYCFFPQSSNKFATSKLLPTSYWPERIVANGVGSVGSARGIGRLSEDGLSGCC